MNKDKIRARWKERYILSLRDINFRSISDNRMERS